MYVIPASQLKQIAVTQGPGFAADIVSQSKLIRGEYHVSDSVWSDLTRPKPGLGDRLEHFLKPIARALKLNCLDANGQLKKNSGCARRRDKLNQLSKPHFSSPPPSAAG